MEEGSLDDDLKITKGDTFPNYLAGHNRKKFTGRASHLKKRGPVAYLFKPLIRGSQGLSDS
jgi:hypothetical protein